MRLFTHLFILCFTVLVASGHMAQHAVAQNLFAPAIKVNDQVVTEYEVQQRMNFLKLLRSPGDPRQEALKALLNDRLQLNAAVAAGIILSDDQVLTGMEEFAGRANLSVADFTKAIAGGGVAQETFRDFVKSGLAWRELVRAKFGPRAQITEAEIDRAVALSSSKGGIRVLLSEIILPAPPQLAAKAQRRADRISKITSIPVFASQARQHSASASRGRSGRLEWMPLSNLPPQIRGAVLALSPGQVTAPIAIPNGIVLFQMRGIEETNAPEVTDVSLEYAAYYIAGGRTEAGLREAARVKGKVDTCDDLYSIAKGQSEETLQIDVLPIADVPQDVALELAKLDEGEISTNLTRSNGETLVFLMLCGRTPELGEEVSRDSIRQQLFNQRLASYADGYLAELKADATIVYP